MNVIDVLTSPWAIMPDKLEEITSIYSTHLRGGATDIKALEAKAGKPLSNPAPGYDIVDGVAVIPIRGVLAKRMNLFTQISGGASTQLVQRDFLITLTRLAALSMARRNWPKLFLRRAARNQSFHWLTA